MATDFEVFGGKEFFSSLVKDFYQEIITDPILKPMYPEDDIDGAIERLTLFLMQYWGGPTTYSDQRGHPDAWLKNMEIALGKQTISDENRTKLWNYLMMAADSMVNTRSDGVI
jgi:hemoglobin